MYISGNPFKKKGCFIPVVVVFLVVVDPVVVVVVVWFGLRHSHFGSHRSGILVAKITDIHILMIRLCRNLNEIRVTFAKN